jgi:predicted transcriptional regulator
LGSGVGAGIFGEDMHIGVTFLCVEVGEQPLNEAALSRPHPDFTLVMAWIRRAGWIPLIQEMNEIGGKGRNFQSGS